MVNKNFTTVQEYIDSVDEKFQAKLQELQRIILASCPENTMETISYKMPTYRNKGNLIHFALNKNHIGIYPGAEAIEFFQEQICTFKTTKGAIQIPLDVEIPTTLIQELIEFNVNRFQEKSAVRWGQYRDQWVEAYEVMEQIIQSLNVEKTLKWGMDIYTYKGKNLVGWGGFKNFFSIWFYNGVFLEDKAKHLIAATEGKTKSLRQWRFKDVSEMNPKLIRSYIQESMQTIEDGKELKPEKPKILEPEGYLKMQLDTDISLKEAFYNLTPSKRKDYILYIQDAKQEKTKISRFEKIKPMILQGVGLHDKYKR